MSKNLQTLIEEWQSTGGKYVIAEQLISMLIDARDIDDAEITQLILERDHWEEKATELAEDIGSALGFEVGEHSNINCPVQNAIDGVYNMRAQIDCWKELAAEAL